MVGEVRSVLTRPQAPAGETKWPGRWLLIAGVAAFGVALAGYVIYMVVHPKKYTLDPVDLAVYRSAIEAGVRGTTTLADMGLELVTVRVSAVSPSADLEKAIEAPMRERI